MIVVDTSAWVEFFRGTGSAEGRTLRRLLATPGSLAVTEVVVMELLAGARTPRHRLDLRALLLRLRLLPLRGLHDYERAAELYRTCRAGGDTIRKITDCLVAVPAIEADAPLLHADADFLKLARHTPLKLAALDE